MSRSILTPALPVQHEALHAAANPTEQLSSQGSSYTLQGQGTPLVFIHAVGLNKSIWFAQASQLMNHYQVLAYDILGHGRSRLPPERPDLRDYVQQLIALMNELGIYQAHVVGHSLGAMIALELALTHPMRCLSVSALSPVFERSAAQRRAAMARMLTRSRLGGQAALAATLARWFSHPIPDRDLPGALLAQHALDTVDPIGFQRGYELFAQCDAAHADRLSELRVPALFMTGEHDPNSTPKMANTMARLVPGSMVRVLPKGRHMMCLSQAELVNAQLLQFFKSIDDADDVCPQALQTLLGRLSRCAAKISMPGSGHPSECICATDFALVSRTPLMVMVSISKAEPGCLELRASEAFTMRLSLHDPAMRGPTRSSEYCGWMECAPVQKLDYGDHAQLICVVHGLGAGPHRDAATHGNAVSH